MNRLTRFSIAILALLLSAALPRQSAADDRLEDSLEWASIDADMIVRAKVISKTEEPQSADEIRWHKLKLNILETIKGPSMSEVEVAEWFDYRFPDWGRLNWFNSKDEILIFLDPRERFGGGSGMPGDCKWVVRKQGGWYVTHNSSEALPLGGRWGMSHLTVKYVHGADLLANVRQTATWSINAGKVLSKTIRFDQPMWKFTDESGLIIPMAEPFFEQMRYYAAHDDSKYSNSFMGYQTLPPWNEWEFLEREKTYRMLRGLNIPADRPILQGPADMHEPAGRTLIGVVLIALAWPIGWLFACRKSRHCFRFGSMMAIWQLAIAAVLTIVWVLSDRQAVSIAWQHNGARWQIASYGGIVRLARVVDHDDFQLPQPIGVVGGIFRLDPQNTSDWNLRDVTLAKPFEKWGITIGEGRPLYRISLSNKSRTQPAIWVTILPWLWPVATFGTFALIFAVIQLRKSHTLRIRRKQGYCPICGYDLRVTPDRCPECGATSQPATPTP